MFEQLAFFSALQKEKIYWSWKFYLGDDEVSYKLEFVSKPIKDKYFKFIYNTFLKKKAKLEYGEVKEGTKLELQQDLLPEFKDKLLSIVPRINTKYSLLSKETESITMEKQAKGWVIYFNIKGVCK